MKVNVPYSLPNIKVSLLDTSRLYGKQAILPSTLKEVGRSEAWARKWLKRIRQAPLEDREVLSGRSRIPCSQHQAGFGNDERQPKLPVPETDKTDDSKSNGSERQLHLKAAIEGLAIGCGNFIGVEDMTENTIDGGQFQHRFFARFFACDKQMDRDGDQGHCNLDVNIKAWDFKEFVQICLPIQTGK